MTTQLAPPAVTADHALAIARADGIQAYRDLTAYRIEIALEGDGCHVEYYIKQRNGSRITGGGPHYIIDATTGVILNKKYYQ